MPVTEVPQRIPLRQWAGEQRNELGNHQEHQQQADQCPEGKLEATSLCCLIRAPGVDSTGRGEHLIGNFGQHTV